MAIQGVDFSVGRPNLACLREEGKKFAIRYTSIGAHAKNMSAAETRALTAAGFRVVTVFEESAGRMLQGAKAGTTDAQVSKAMAEKAGAHERSPHFFALDVDTTPLTEEQWKACEAYLNAAAKVLGRARVGVYGDYRAVRRLANEAPWRWQTYAWSHGEWWAGAQLQQYKNEVRLCGAEVDLDRALKGAYGQWGFHVRDSVDLKRAVAFAKTCDPIPYKMRVQVGRDGIDCSGFQSVLSRSLMDYDNVWVRMFATGNIASLVQQGRLPFIWPGKGDANDFNMGFVFPWEMSSGVGHCAGTLPGIGGVESRGGKGVLLGTAARRHDNPLFRHFYHIKLDAPTKTSPAPTFPAFPGRIMKLGMSGADVRRYQSQMHHRGWDIAVDGDFGPKTQAMTKAFQRQVKLTADGEVGPNTWKAAFTAPITR